MKQLLLSSVALVALGASASAADLAPRYTKAPTMVDPAYNWTGFYVGLHAGAASSDGDLTTLITDGFIGGGQIGYNYQSGMSVFGFEADASSLNVKSSFSGLDPFFTGKGNTATL